MKEELLEVLACSHCHGCFSLRKTRVMKSNSNNFEREEIKNGILKCVMCGRDYPVVNGIPRLRLELDDDETAELREMNKEKGCVAETKNAFSAPGDKYQEIEKIIRQRLIIPANAGEYLKQRLENDIKYRVKECEKQDKYIATFRQYFTGPIDVVLDVGGAQGGLSKCFDEKIKPRLSIIPDHGILWTEVANLRNSAVQLVRGDARYLPFKRNSIDLVISQAMLEHIESHDKVINEICAVAKKACFVCWNPNKFFVYDLGHLDAPVTIFPKPLAKKIAIFWHKLRRTGRAEKALVTDLDSMFYVSTSYVRNILSKHGHVYNVFSAFVQNSLLESYSYRMKFIKHFLAKSHYLTKIICNILTLLQIEPQCYYILIKENGIDNSKVDTR